MASSISFLGIFHMAIAFIAIISMAITTFRLAKGPAILDRSIALDVLVSGAIAFTAVVIVSLKREDLGVLLVVFALTSFISGVVIARFARKSDSFHKPVLSEEEARRQVAEREREAADAELIELTDAQVQAEEQSSQDSSFTPQESSVTYADQSEQGSQDPVFREGKPSSPAGEEQ